MAPPPYAMWTQPAPATERRSSAMAITGIGFWAAGIATTGTGVGLLVNAAMNPCVNFALEAGVARPVSSFGERIGQARQAFGMCDNTGSIGAVLIVVGAVVGLVGIPLFVVGNRQVPVKPEAIPEVRPGLGGGELRWVF